MSETPPLSPESIDARVRKHSVTIAGHRTSISLEEPFWERLKQLAVMDGRPLAQLVGEVDAARSRGEGGNLSGALRVYVLQRLTAMSGVVLPSAPSRAGRPRRELDSDAAE